MHTPDRFARGDQNFLVTCSDEDARLSAVYRIETDVLPPIGSVASQKVEANVEPKAAGPVEHSRFCSANGTAGSNDVLGSVRNEAQDRSIFLVDHDNLAVT
jgi:hypothetical protein